MPLIKNRQIQTQDAWQFISGEAFQPDLLNKITDNALVLPAEKLVEVNLENITQLGAYLTTEQDYELLLPYLDKLTLIALVFLAFRDGRGFSQARLLRRAGFKGELRAVGEVTRDRLAYLESCGFDAFDIPAERFKTEDLAAFAEVKVSYQQPLKQEHENGIA